MELIVAWTDGACSGNPGPGGWACQIGDELESGRFPNTTNNTMELHAAHKALEMCPPYHSLEIVTDSKLTIGLLSWGWKTKHPHLQAEIEAFRAVQQAKQIPVRFRWVKGHAGVAGNVKVDKAAAAQAKIQQNANRAKAGGTG